MVSSVDGPSQKLNLSINSAETAMSHLDFTGVIEEHNEVHHRQRLMELPVRIHSRQLLVCWFKPSHFLLQSLDCLQLDLDLGMGNNVQQPPQQANALHQEQVIVPQQRVNSVIRALPQQQQHHHPAATAPPQRHPEDRTKGDLIAEKLKLLASDRSSEEAATTLKKDQEVDEEQDLLSLLGEQQLLLPQEAVDNLSNYMMWEVKEEEVSHS